MILTSRFGALRARRNFTVTPEVSDERELRTDVELKDRTAHSHRADDKRAA